MNVSLTEFAIRPGPVSGGRSGSRCRMCIEKTFPNAKNLSQGAIIILWHQARFYTIQKICVIDHRMKVICALSDFTRDLTIQHYTLPLLSCLPSPLWSTIYNLSHLHVWLRRSIGPVQRTVRVGPCCVTCLRMKAEIAYELIE